MTIGELDDVGAHETTTTAAGDREGLPEAIGARPLRVDVWRRFRKNRMAMVGLVVIALLLILAIFAPWIAPSSITDQYRPTRQGPTAEHWFGTDRVGRDIFSRIVHGARVSMRIGLTATAMSLGIGLVVGAISGFFGGFIDTVLMRFVDIMYAIPYIILAVALATVVGRSVNSVILILGLTGWIGIARIVRSSFLSLKKLEYVEAARALGYSRRRIVLRHILPNALQPIIVYGTIAIGSVILAEAALSFLSVGPQDPTPAWGLMVNQGTGLLTTSPHILLIPGAAIFITVLSFVFVGDGLRDALDPKLK